MANQPTPQLFFDTIWGYQHTEALRTAVELDLFTAIGEGTATPAGLAGRCRASERGLRILCDYMTTLGFLSKQGGQYTLTPDAATFIDRR